MTRTGLRAVSGGRSGFTMVELLVGLVVGLIVLGSIRETAREATALLAWDLRQSAVGGSPLAAMGANTISLRSPRGMGTICAKHPTLARYGLWKTGGNIFATVDDSAIVYQLGRDKWQALKITAVGTPGVMGVAACAWPGARPPDVG